MKDTVLTGTTPAPVVLPIRQFTFTVLNQSFNEVRSGIKFTNGSATLPEPRAIDYSDLNSFLRENDIFQRKVMALLELGYRLDVTEVSVGPTTTIPVEVPSRQELFK